MPDSFQDVETITALYSQADLIQFRGEFIKNYSTAEISMRQRIHQLIDYPQVNHLLDFGCGNCSFLHRLQRTQPHVSLTGIDIIHNPSCDAVETLHYIVYPSGQFPELNQKYEVITCMHVMYHIPNHDDLLQFFKNHLTSHGQLIITTKSIRTFRKQEEIFQRIAAEMNIEDATNQREEAHFCMENAREIIQRTFNKEDYQLREIPITGKLITRNLDDVLRYVFSTRRYAKSEHEVPSSEYLSRWRTEIQALGEYVDWHREVIYIIQGHPSAP